MSFISLERYTKESNIIEQKLWMEFSICHKNDAFFKKYVILDITIYVLRFNIL